MEVGFQNTYTYIFMLSTGDYEELKKISICLFFGFKVPYCTKFYTFKVNRVIQVTYCKWYSSVVVHRALSTIIFYKANC